MGLPARNVEAVLAAIEARRRVADRRPFVVGLCGAQGSGKSTLAAMLGEELGHAGVAAALLSLDDLYRTQAERMAMAAGVHPLFRTRGVPGTHDVALGEAVLAALAAGHATKLPRFDKGIDDRAAPATWPEAPVPTEVLILEGWFVGATPQDEAALGEPVNTLERDEDPDGRWRRAANRALGDYAVLFDRVDLLVFLAAPSFGVVCGWRREQEEALRRHGRGMDDTAIARFVAHYERLTRHLLETLPARADLVVRLGGDRTWLDVVPSPALSDQLMRASPYISP